MLLLVTVTEQNFDWSLLVQRRWGWFTSRFTYYTADNTFFFREHHNRKITTVLSVTDKRHVYDYTVFQPAAYKNRLCNANNCEIDSPHLLWGRVLPLNRGLTMYPAKARLLGGFGNGPRKKKKWPRVSTLDHVPTRSLLPARPAYELWLLPSLGGRVLMNTSFPPRYHNPPGTNTSTFAGISSIFERGNDWWGRRVGSWTWTSGGEFWSWEFYGYYLFRIRE